MALRLHYSLEEVSQLTSQRLFFKYISISWFIISLRIFIIFSICALYLYTFCTSKLKSTPSPDKYRKKGYPWSEQHICIHTFWLRKQLICIADFRLHVVNDYTNFYVWYFPILGSDKGINGTLLLATAFHYYLWNTFIHQSEAPCTMHVCMNEDILVEFFLRVQCTH